HEQHVRRAVAGEHFVVASSRRHTRWPGDWSSDVCSSDLEHGHFVAGLLRQCERRDAAVQYGWDDPARHFGRRRVLLTWITELGAGVADLRGPPRRIFRRVSRAALRARGWRRREAGMALGEPLQTLASVPGSRIFA